jgi:acyl carrier protein
MLDPKDRLIRCFSSVFPGLSQEDILQTSADAVGEWDSLSHVTLAAVIQEEFGIEIDPQILQELNSFDAFHEYLERSGAAYIE